VKITYKGKNYEIKGEEELSLFFEKEGIRSGAVFFIDLRSKEVIQRKELLKSEKVEIKPFISGG
jgi:hypothetical protein